MDCTDDRGYTPLFFATKIGSLSNMMELIDHGADVNHETSNVERPCHKITYCTIKKTPLFRARNYDSVMLLLKNGADPTATATYYDSNGGSHQVTVFQHVIKFNNDCAKAILDNALTKENENDLIMDFGVFIGNEKGKFELEMLETANKHSSIQLVEDSVDQDKKTSILLHPLFQIFLGVKFNTIQKIYIMQIIYQILLTLVVTLITVRYVQLTSCRLDDDKNQFESQFGINGFHLSNGSSLLESKLCGN